MACTNDFILNYENLYLIDITPETTATYARLAAGLSSADPENNEELDQTKYLDGDGHGSTSVIGMQRTVAFSGHRDANDAAQNYIFSKEFELGNERCTTFRQIDKYGNIVEKSCTIATLNPGGGDAGAKSEIGFEIHLNGKPVKTPKQGATALSITVAAGSVVGSTKFTATPTGTNTLAYSLTAVEVTGIYLYQAVSGLTTYTSGDDIPSVTAGQWINAYELDEFGRVAKFVSYEIQAGDIAV